MILQLQTFQLTWKSDVEREDWTPGGWQWWRTKGDITDSPEAEFDPSWLLY